jgi:hypothetical protein
MCFSVWNPLLSYYKERSEKWLWNQEIIKYDLIKQAKFLPLYDPKELSNILLQKFGFYQLIQCHIPQALYQELQNLPFASFLPLTTKYSDRYMPSIAPIIDLFICMGNCCYVTSKIVNCNCHCSTVVTTKLTNNWETECIHIC